VRFCASLKTEDRQVAERRAAALLTKWLGIIGKAKRAGTRGAHASNTSDADFWRTLLADAPEDQRELLRDLLVDEARERVDRAAERAGITDDGDPRYSELPEPAREQRLVALATGKLVPLQHHLEDFLATLKDTSQTIQGKRATVLEIASVMPMLQDVTRRGVQQWLTGLANSGLKAATLRRKIAEVRPYWTYLVGIQEVPEDLQPFDKVAIPRDNGRDAKDTVRKAFTATEVVQLLNAAVARGDTAVADMIRLGMWTGARIEELASLKFENVRDGAGYLVISASKTKAGVREVPIHSKLRPTIKRLVKAAAARPDDPYLIGGQRADKYNDRSGAIGSRFSRLKRAAGHGEELVFHSLRKTVATLLENAGVPEGVAADILGHEKKTLSYGLYSSGSSMQRKIEAIEKLAYPSL
jgi:integrase